MKELPTKVTKKLPEGFLESIQGMDTEEVKKRIVEARSNIYHVENDLATNEKIIAAKEDLKEMTSPYRETKSLENAKITAAIWILEERGVEMGVQEKA